MNLRLVSCANRSRLSTAPVWNRRRLFRKRHHGRTLRRHFHTQTHSRRFWPTTPATTSTSRLRRAARRGTTRASTGSATSTSTTPAAASTRESQIREHLELLADGVFGNPHSHNPTSLATTQLVERRAPRCCEFFNADPDEYDVVFTANASGALKLVGESYPFGRGDRYLLTYDNHNSVNGIREFARAAGRERHLRARRRRRSCGSTARWSRPSSRERPPARSNLFAFPAQSNFSGVQHPLEWVDVGAATRAGTCCSTARPSRRPTGSTSRRSSPTSCRCRSTRCSATPPASARSSPARGSSPSCGGRGSPAARSRSRRCRARAGTTSRPATPASRTAPSTTSACPPSRSASSTCRPIGIDAIHERVVALTSWLLGEMTALRHANGAPMVRVFGPTDMERRGGTIAFYLLDPDGTPYDVAPARGARRPRAASPCAPAASATPATARSRTTSRATTWPSASSEAAAGHLHRVPRHHPGRDRQDAQHDARLARDSRPTSPTSTGSWRFAEGFRDVPAEAIRT